MTLYSVFIPRVFSNITEKRIINTFHNLDIGDVHHVDLIKRTNINGKSYNMAFVHFNGFYDTKSAQSFKMDIENKDKKAKIVYDDPWFWLVLPFELKPQDNNNKNNNSSSQYHLQQSPMNHFQSNYCFPMHPPMHPMYQPVMFCPVPTMYPSYSQKKNKTKDNKYMMYKNDHKNYNQPKVRINVSKLTKNNYKKNKLLINDNDNNEEFEEGEILDEDNNPKIKGWDIKY